MKCAKMWVVPGARNQMINYGDKMEKLLSGSAQKMCGGGNSVPLLGARGGDDFHEVVSISGWSCDSRQGLFGLCLLSSEFMRYL